MAEAPNPCSKAATTSGHLLGGRVSYAQPRLGFRTGIEPVLLAASVPALAGERVIEAGTGAGAALLCLAARVCGIQGVGIERDPVLAGLAGANAAANQMAGLEFHAGDIETFDAGVGCFDHAFANPPYHPAGGSPSPVVGRARAKQADAGLFSIWAMRLGRSLRHRGSLTFIVPASQVPTCLIAMAAASCPASALFPLWPHYGDAAKLVLLRGVRGGRGSLRLMAGLVLHEANGRFTDEAEAVLRQGSGLKF